MTDFLFFNDENVRFAKLHFFIQKNAFKFYLLSHFH